MFRGWHFGLNYDALSRIAKVLIGGYLPVPSIGLNYWNNPLCLDRRLFPLNLFSSLTVLGYVAFVLAGLRRNPTAMFVFGGGTAGLLAFFDAARALSRPSGQPLLLVLGHQLDEGMVGDNQMSELGTFDGAVVPDENFHL